MVFNLCLFRLVLFLRLGLAGGDDGGGVESGSGNGSGGAMIPFTECVIYIWERINLLLMKKTSTRSWACFLCCCSPPRQATISRHKLFRLCFSHCVIWLRPARMTEWVKHDNGKAGGGRGRERERGIWSGSAKNKPHIRKSLTVIVDQWIGALSQRTVLQGGWWEDRTSHGQSSCFFVHCLKPQMNTRRLNEAKEKQYITLQIDLWSAGQYGTTTRFTAEVKWNIKLTLEIWRGG